MISNPVLKFSIVVLFLLSAMTLSSQNHLVTKEVERVIRLNFNFLNKHDFDQTIPYFPYPNYDFFPVLCEEIQKGNINAYDKKDFSQRVTEEKIKEAFALHTKSFGPVFYSYTLKETWIFNKKDLSTSIQLKAIAPMDQKTKTPLFWINFDLAKNKIEPLLRNMVCLDENLKTFEVISNPHPLATFKDIRGIQLDNRFYFIDTHTNDKRLYIFDFQTMSLDASPEQPDLVSVIAVLSDNQHVILLTSDQEQTYYIHRFDPIKKEWLDRELIFDKHFYPKESIDSFHHFQFEKPIGTHPLHAFKGNRKLYQDSIVYTFFNRKINSRKKGKPNSTVNLESIFTTRYDYQIKGGLNIHRDQYVWSDDHLFLYTKNKQIPRAYLIKPVPKKHHLSQGVFFKQKIIFVDQKKLLIYNFQTQEWTISTSNLPEGLLPKHLCVVDNSIYVIAYDSKGKKTEFIRLQFDFNKTKKEKESRIEDFNNFDELSKEGIIFQSRHASKTKPKNSIDNLHPIFANEQKILNLIKGLVVKGAIPIYQRSEKNELLPIQYQKLKDNLNTTQDTFITFDPDNNFNQVIQVVDASFELKDFTRFDLYTIFSHKDIDPNHGVPLAIGMLQDIRNEKGHFRFSKKVFYVKIKELIKLLPEDIFQPSNNE